LEEMQNIRWYYEISKAINPTKSNLKQITL